MKKMIYTVFIKNTDQKGRVIIIEDMSSYDIYEIQERMRKLEQIKRIGDFNWEISMGEEEMEEQ
ncbi:MAG: hypothetical protein SV062_08225 [Thermodesulfobacteriota bacterium]|nr:hypothetical protein [Thermodesulfobacteriota bacterium]